MKVARLLWGTLVVLSFAMTARAARANDVLADAKSNGWFSAAQFGNVQPYANYITQYEQEIAGGRYVAAAMLLGKAVTEHPAHADAPLVSVGQAITLLVAHEPVAAASVWNRIVFEQCARPAAACIKALEAFVAYGLDTLLVTFQTSEALRACDAGLSFKLPAEVQRHLFERCLPLFEYGGSPLFRRAIAALRASLLGPAERERMLVSYYAVQLDNATALGDPKADLAAIARNPVDPASAARAAELLMKGDGKWVDAALQLAPRLNRTTRTSVLHAAMFQRALAEIPKVVTRLRAGIDTYNGPTSNVVAFATRSLVDNLLGEIDPIASNILPTSPVINLLVGSTLGKMARIVAGLPCTSSACEAERFRSSSWLSEQSRERCAIIVPLSDDPARPGWFIDCGVTPRMQRHPRTLEPFGFSPQMLQ